MKVYLSVSWLLLLGLCLAFSMTDCSGNGGDDDDGGDDTIGDDTSDCDPTVTYPGQECCVNTKDCYSWEHFQTTSWFEECFPMNECTINCKDEYINPC
jgi:hypothetical protein